MVPGHRYDLFSSFYPLGAASPVMTRLGLEQWGLRWRRAPLAIGHPFLDGRSALLSTDLSVTCESLETFGAGQGDHWLSLFQRWKQVGGPLLDSLIGTPFPPVRAPLTLVARLGTADLVRLARFAMLPLRRMCDEEGLLDGATMLLAGNALHSDLTPELPLSGFFGWLLAMLAQDVGYPVPEGGAGEITGALVRRLESLGGEVVCNRRITHVEIHRGHARAAVAASGERYDASRAIIADVSAPALYRDLIGEEHLPAAVIDDLDRFQLDNSTFKVDWLLDRSIPWRVEAVSDAGTVHIADSLTELAHTGLELAERCIPAKPFVVVGQSSVADPTRTPDDSQMVWAYTHVPQRIRSDAGGDLTGSWSTEECDEMAGRIEARIEAHAPGFRSAVRERRILSPHNLVDRDANLIGGALNGGSAALHQQLIFRPTPGLGRPSTPVKGLFLASASAHPGGGVHGACGANAARAAIARHRTRRSLFASAAVGASALGTARHLRQSRSS
jgi:phytoene dehydrogenase-like protein